MARRPYSTNPSQKHLEEFRNFAGGLNTEFVDDKLGDEEVPMLVNKELSTRGSVSRRHGMIPFYEGQVGQGQGYFRFFRQSDGGYNSIFAINGSLVVDGVTKVSGLQATRQMEAVQYRDKLYIATGSGLYQWDGNTMSLVTPYMPMPLEALYVGTNGLADNPSSYIQDGSSSSIVTLIGVVPSKRYGLVNTDHTFTAYANIPTGATIQYIFEYRMLAEAEDKYKVFRDWSTDKVASGFNPTEAGEYVIRISAKRQGEPTIDSFYQIPKYVVKPTVDPKDNEIPAATLNQCNRILLHWDRLLLYGDPVQPDVVYISHLKNPAYFPVPNSLQFTNPKQEGLTALVRFRDNIVAFTKTSIQGLYGKSPSDFQRVMINTAVGCIAPYSAKVFDNYVAFLSYDGVQVMKSLAYSENMANTKVVSERVKDQIPLVENAVAEVYDGQYHIVFPDTNTRMRFYYNQGVWVKDESPEFNICRMYSFDDNLLVMHNQGKVSVFDETVLTDNGYVYEDYIETRFYDFGQVFNRKKIREIQLLTGAVKEQTNIAVEVYIKDKNTATINHALVLEPTTGIPLTVKGLASDKHELKVAGKGLMAKVVIRHNEAKPFHLLGLSFIFKVKKA